LDAWIAGKGEAALMRKLEVAQREKNRFFASRIAQTELARASGQGGRRVDGRQHH
jgi:hypothetical protein